VSWIATDVISEEDALGWRDPGADASTLAFLQYTSGSTASPKGVTISHGNLLHNLTYSFHSGSSDASTVSVSWLPVIHDMGLIEGVLQPAFSGCPAYLIPPTAFLQRPARWLNAISRYRATRSGGPNFAYDLCVRRIGAEERTGLDLSTWRAAYNGAEPVRSETMRAFASAFADCGFESSAFRPCFGLAEATLLVTAGTLDGDRSLGQAVDSRQSTVGSRSVAGGEDRREATGAPPRVSCGTPAFGTRVLVADPETGRPCADGSVGEIWVSGPSVAQGYWNRPEESVGTFGARTDRGEGPFLRTGDLGFLHDGELYVTGRLKDVLIVRGTKHYPQDLEQTVEQQHPALRPGCAAAFAIEVGPVGDRIAVVAEADIGQLGSPESAPAAIAAIRRSVTELHGVQLGAVLLVAPGTLPKTTSGKLQRFACRDAYLSGNLPVLAAWRDSATERELCA
jgi:acyl-CoA synthetase (AMP-forming)/AMP-acid ligase II